MKPNQLYKFILLVFISLQLISCKTGFQSEWTEVEAPNTFRARFETTRGKFDIVAHKEWSPKAVDRLYQLIESGFYEDMAFYRVIPNFVAQWGESTDSVLKKGWESHPVPDEQLVRSNTRGTIAFARNGAESRLTNLFINLRDNYYLDTINFNNVVGFPVIAEVVCGMSVVDSLYNGYGPQLQTAEAAPILLDKDELRKQYPRLDYILKAYIIEDKK